MPSISSAATAELTQAGGFRGLRFRTNAGAPREHGIFYGNAAHSIPQSGAYPGVRSMMGTPMSNALGIVHVSSVASNPLTLGPGPERLATQEPARDGRLSAWSSMEKRRQSVGTGGSGGSPQTHLLTVNHLHHHHHHHHHHTASNRRRHMTYASPEADLRISGPVAPAPADAFLAADGADDTLLASAVDWEESSEETPSESSETTATSSAGRTASKGTAADASATGPPAMSPVTVQRGRSELEDAMLAASLRTVPLHFVVQEMERRVSEAMVKHDLLYFVPFLLLFTVNYLVGRSIEENYFASGAVRAMASDNIFNTMPYESSLLAEKFRQDTNANYVNGTQHSDPFLHGWGRYDFVFSWYSSQLNMFNSPPSTPEVVEQLYRVSGDISMKIHATFGDITDKGTFMRWLRMTLVPGLWDCKNPSYKAKDRTRPRGNTALVGALRLRSIRMKAMKSCSVNAAIVKDPLAAANTQCYAGFSSSNVDSEPYCNIPNPANPAEKLFQYEDCGNAALSTRASETDYPCLGHVATLPFSSSCDEVDAFMRLISPPLASRSNNATYTTVLEELSMNFVENEFNRSSCAGFAFHDAMRLVAVEFFTYTSSTDSFVRAAMMLEGTAGGRVVPTYTGSVFRIFSFHSQLLSFLLQLSLLTFSLYFLTKFWDDWGSTTRQTGSRLEFLLDLWNLVDLTNLVCMMVSSSLYVAWVTTSLHTDVEFNRSPRYPEHLEVIQYVYSTQVYCNAVNVILVFIKTLKYVRINDRLNILTRTFSHAQNNIISLLALWIFIHIGFALTGMQLFGASMRSYSNFNTAFSTLLFALLGITDIEKMQRIQPVLTHIFFWSFFILENFMLLNFFIAILSDGFQKMNESVALAPLDVAVLRFVDEVLMTLRWKYLRERLLGLLRTNASRFELLIEVKLCLEDHLQLALRAATDVTRSHRDQVPTNFRDLRWWLPEALFEALGNHYMMVLWEDIVHEYYQSSCKSSHSVDLDNLGAAVAKGIKDEIEKDTPDVIALELQSELLADKLSSLPVLLCQFDIVKRLSEKLNENVRKELRRAGAKHPTTTGGAARRRSTIRQSRAVSIQSQAAAEDRRLSSVMPAERSDSEESSGASAESLEDSRRRPGLAPSFVAFQD
jgi:hypothetical protein